MGLGALDLNPNSYIYTYSIYYVCVYILSCYVYLNTYIYIYMYIHIEILCIQKPLFTSVRVNGLVEHLASRRPKAAIRKPLKVAEKSEDRIKESDEEHAPGLSLR